MGIRKAPTLFHRGGEPFHATPLAFLICQEQGAFEPPRLMRKDRPSSKVRGPGLYIITD